MLDVYAVMFVDSFVQQEFAQMSGEGGLEAADGGVTIGDGAAAAEPHRDDISAADSGDDSGSSNASSDGKPRLHASLGAEVSAQDKDIMIKAFLEGTGSLHATETDHVANEIGMQVDELPEQPPDTSLSVPLPSAFDFTTPPTKLFLRNGSVDLGIQDVVSAAKITGDLQESVDALPSQMASKTRFQRQASMKSASSSKLKVETYDAPVFEETSGSHEGGSSWSERKQRDRKMAFIVVLCAAAFVIFNAATYLYLVPVKIGSGLFDELHTLLDIQAQLDLPKSRFFPILLHIAGLMNPSLMGIDRQIQTEDLNALIIEFKESLTHWQLQYSSNTRLSDVLREELSIVMNMCVLILSSHVFDVSCCPITSDCDSCQVGPFEFIHSSLLGIWPVRQSTVRFVWHLCGPRK